MTDNILPEPVNDYQVNQPQVDTPIPQPKSSKSNRTLIILVIIVLIAFLGLVAGVVDNYLTKNNQDNTRKHDLAYIASEAESFYNFNHFYPTLSQFNSSTFAAFSPQGLKRSDFKDPSGSSELLSGSVTPTGYSYEVTPKACNNISVKCEHFKLVAILSSNKQYVVPSKH